MEHLLKAGMREAFLRQLQDEEKSEATIRKYGHDIGLFFDYVGQDGRVDKAILIAYKEGLIMKYAAVSVNSMLAAVNAFLKRQGWYDCIVKSLKIQKQAFRAGEQELTKEEYYRLLKSAGEKGNDRLNLIMQTLCATGIRVSELKYITVAALQTGRAQVQSKGKLRTVLLPQALCRKLKAYTAKRKIREGSIFVTRSGRAMDRSNICHEMKALGEAADISRKKIFPHNLRHLFATTYYSIRKDLSHLADLLGHSDINTTRIYTLISSEEQSRQIEGMELVV